MINVSLLQQLLSKNEVIPIKFAGHRLLFDASGTLIWPNQDLIIFSDLHLEKGSFLSQFANPLPRFDSTDTLKRMKNAIEKYKCSRVVCLGDSLHDGNALSRMQSNDLKNLNKLVSLSKQWLWILGNHDPEIPNAIYGQRAPYCAIENVLLVHEPENLSEHNGITGQIIGHYHPKASFKLANRKVTGKGFVCDEKILLMPAFGKYTGGLDIKDEAFKPLFQLSKAQVYLLFNHKIYML